MWISPILVYKTSNGNGVKSLIRLSFFFYMWSKVMHQENCTNNEWLNLFLFSSGRLWYVVKGNAPKNYKDYKQLHRTLGDYTFILLIYCERWIYTMNIMQNPGKSLKVKLHLPQPFIFKFRLLSSFSSLFVNLGRSFRSLVESGQ